METIKVQDITTDHVRGVYSGKLGCACGCRGKHSYNPALQAEASEEQGYPVTDDELSAVAVKNVLRRVQSSPSIDVDPDGAYVAAETETRMYVVYLRRGVRVGA